MRTIHFLICLALGASSGQVAAQEGVRADRIMATSALEKECGLPENTNLGIVSQAHCLGFLVGVVDTAMTLNAYFRKEQTICLEKADDADSMRLAFLSFVRRNPDVRDLPAATATMAMLAQNYPCKKP